MHGECAHSSSVAAAREGNHLLMSTDPGRLHKWDGRWCGRRSSNGGVGILFDVRGDRLLAQLEDKIAGVINLFDTERHGLRAISMGLDQRVPTGALIAVVATRTCSVPGADTALTED